MTFSNGINAPKESYGNGRKMISVMDILDNQKINYDDIRNSVKVDKRIEDKNMVENGDLIFVRSSEIAKEVGLTKAYLEDRYALYSGFTIRGKKQKKFNSYFMELELNYSCRKQIERKAGGSTRFNISQEILNNIEILIPKIEEQNKISDLFSNIENTTALHQGKLEKLKELKNGLLQQMFPKKDEKTPKLRFTNFKDDWSKKKIKYLGEIRTGNTPSTSENKFWIKGSEGYPWITPSDISSNNTKYTEKKLSKEGWEVSRKVPKNSVLVTCIASIGKNTINLEDSAFNQQINAIIPIKNNSYFILTLMNKNSKLFESLAGKTATSIINKNDFSNIPLIITNIQEQQKIGDLFKKIDILQAQHEQKLDKLQLLKKSLLQKMFI